jgi:hypothetical protein
MPYLNVYKGKEGYRSITNEVIFMFLKFIQAVTIGHPGSRNDTHIVWTDGYVMQLLQGNCWLRSMAWQTVGQNGTMKHYCGEYLICDGGYHRWPFLIPPSKAGVPGSPHIKWSECKIRVGQRGH